MKKVLGIVCSQRKNGNCETFVKEVSRNIPEEHELKLLRLPEFHMEPCNGCYRCLVKDECVHDDGLLAVLEAIKESDGIILASPVYILGAHSSLRMLLDRALAFYNHGDQLFGKPFVAAGLAGLENKEGKTLLDIENFLLTIGADVKQRQILDARLPGDVVLKEENMRVAKEMANALFGEKNIDKSIPHCPLCGGETFRFIGGAEIMCQLCSHKGTVDVNNGQVTFDIKVTDHNLFITGNALDEHKEWLIRMKNLYKERKDELRVVKKEYRHDGEWIRPQADVDTVPV